MKVILLGLIGLLLGAVACGGAGAPEPTPPPDNSTISRIAFATDRDDNWEIYVMNSDGTNAHNISNHPGIDTYPAWSPDGSKIAFQTERDGNLEIYVMNSDGSDPVRLTNDVGKDLWPEWSPDGEKISFTSDRRGTLSIWTMNPDGTEVEDFTGSFIHSRWATWEPKSRRIAYQSDLGVSVVKADGTDSQRIIDNDVFFDGFFVGWLNWSPDGQRLAMISNHQERTTFTRNLYTSELDGLRFRRLYPIASGSPYERPTWSPDGEWIVYAIQASDEGGWDIQVVKFDTQETVRLTNSPGTDTFPDWEPRGFMPQFEQTFVPAPQ